MTRNMKEEIFWHGKLLAVPFIMLFRCCTGVGEDTLIDTSELGTILALYSVIGKEFTSEYPSNALGEQ